jgi:hypothetical protein
VVEEYGNRKKRKIKGGRGMQVGEKKKMEDKDSLPTCSPEQLLPPRGPRLGPGPLLVTPRSTSLFGLVLALLWCIRVCEFLNC